MSRLTATLMAWPAVFFAAVTLSFVTGAVAKLFGVELPDQAQVEFVKRYAGWNMTFAFIVAQVVVIVPAIEEVLFRFLLWKMPLCIARRWRGTWRAPMLLAIPVAALFSFAHYIDFTRVASEHSFALIELNNAFLALFFFGLAQCWLYRKTDRLWCTILNHGLFNLTNLVLLFLLPA